MLVILLGILDIIATVALATDYLSGIAFYLGVIMLIKGLLSVGGSIASKYFLDWMGAVDLVAGVLLIFSWNIPLFWILLGIKGIYSIISGI